MWAFLYSDTQLKQMRDEAVKEAANTREPLHPDYNDRLTMDNAAETIREVDRALDERTEKR